MSALRRNVVFALWRLAAKIDTGHTLLIAKTLTRVHEARQAAEHATVQVEVARSMAQRLDDWSTPIQIRFAETADDGWQLWMRACETTPQAGLEAAIEQAVAERAQRQ